MNKKRSIFITALAFGIPNILQNLVVNLSQMMDNLMVGSLQEYAIAGVTITNQLFFIFTITLFGIGGTAGIFIPQFKSIGNHRKMTDIFHISLLFNLLMGAIFFLAMTVIPTPLFRIFAMDAETIANAHEYLDFIRFTFLLFPFSVAIGDAFRFSGLIKIPMYVSMMTVALNIFFNYIFIFGNFGMPAMGVAGAGLGTLMARIAELGIYLFLTIKIPSPVKLFKPGAFSFEKSLLIQFIQKGYGLVFNEIFWSLGMQILTVIYTRRESHNIAAMSISGSFTRLIFIGMGGMSVAFSLILGESLGQNRFEDAKRDAGKLLKLSTMLGLVLGIGVLVISYLLIDVYEVTLETRHMAERIIWVNVAFSWLYYLNSGYYFTLRSGGDTKSVLLIDSGFVWVITIPLAFIIGRLDLLLPIHFLIIQFNEVLKWAIAKKMLQKGIWLQNLTTSTP